MRVRRISRAISLSVITWLSSVTAMRSITSARGLDVSNSGQENQARQHQKACPMEKKNWK